jgi:hypothetical protein
MKRHFSRSRRSFFKNLVLLGGSAALTGFAGRGFKLRKNAPKVADTTGKAYRMTPHIQAYYRTADR